MSTPTLFEIAEELNRRAHEHPIGQLQEIRGHRPGVELFRLKSNTMRKQWACHWGGRTELQFNIGLNEESTFRHGVAFSLEESRVYNTNELLKELSPKIDAYNRFIRRHRQNYPNMGMRVWDCDKDESYEIGSALIPARLVRGGNFLFFGKHQSSRRINYEDVLNDFDQLLPLYQFVESRGTRAQAALEFESQFAFRPGCRPKKASTIIQLSQEQIERDLWHAKLQQKLYHRLADKFGKENVGTEIHGKNGTSIDVVVKKGGNYWFYEIKTAPTARVCIREALGQILEYAFWPGAKEAARLVIVGEHPLDSEAKEYLAILNARFSLPIEYDRIRI